MISAGEQLLRRWRLKGIALTISGISACLTIDETPQQDPVQARDLAGVLAVSTDTNATAEMHRKYAHVLIALGLLLTTATTAPKLLPGLLADSSDDWSANRKPDAESLAVAALLDVHGEHEIQQWLQSRGFASLPDSDDRCHQ